MFSNDGINSRVFGCAVVIAFIVSFASIARGQNWPSFRGANASGVADGKPTPTTWDGTKGTNVLWKTPIPGLAHSCPVVWADKVFVTTAVSSKAATTSVTACTAMLTRTRTL